MDKHFSSYIFNPKEKASCVGCGACSQACPKKAITMHEDDEGFLYPILNEQKCIQCGLCERTCPIVDEKHFSNSSHNQKSYVATNKIHSDSKECATIGLCTMISQWMIKRGGIVYGVILDEKEWNTYHVKAETINDLLGMRNSKYVQSDTKKTFSEVKEFLKSERDVLYIGTPCQIAGLKGFLRKDYPTLFTIDLICHGTYSYKLLQREVAYWSNLMEGIVSNFRFRSKRKYSWTAGGIMNFDLKKSNGESQHIERLAPSSPTYRCYAYSGNGKNYNIRQSCYKCPFREKTRFGDLTIGDAWELGAKYPNVFSIENRKSGVSSVFSNTDKGKKLLSEIDERIELTEIPLKEAFCQPALLPTNREIPTERDYIYQEAIKSADYGRLIGKLFNVDLEKEHKKAVVKYMKKQLKNYIKTIIKWK